MIRRTVLDMMETPSASYGRANQSISNGLLSRSRSSPPSNENTQEDVLSLDSWSDFEQLDISRSPSHSSGDAGYQRNTKRASVSSLRTSKASYKSDTVKAKDIKEPPFNSSSSGSISCRSSRNENEHPSSSSGSKSKHSRSKPINSNYRASSVNIDSRVGIVEAAQSNTPLSNLLLTDSDVGLFMEQPDISDTASSFYGEAYNRTYDTNNVSSGNISTRGLKEHDTDRKYPSLYPILDSLSHANAHKPPKPLRHHINSSRKPPSHLNSSTEFSDEPVSLPDCRERPAVDRICDPFSSLPADIKAESHNQSCLHEYRETSYGPNDSARRKELESSQEKSPAFGRLYKSQPSISNPPALKRQQKSSSDLEAMKDSFEHKLEPENVKSWVLSAWNNFKYGWTLNTKQSMKYDSPLFMLGKCYHKRKNDANKEPENDFIQDFSSRIWMTYRNNFYPIPGTTLVTDCGWGCMLRSAQMLIIQCLVTHFLGREWRIYNQQTETQSTFYREIIRWFSDPIDAPSDKMPFSLHHLVSFGRNYNKEPGEWFGPSSAAFIFRDAFCRARQTIPILSQLCIYVAHDCTVYIDDVVNLCTSREKSESLSNSCSTSSEVEQHRQPSASSKDPWLRSLILLIPMRLGGEAMNEIYVECIKNLLSHENCMGIIGGKPKHSLYFLGYQENKLIYLDPHRCHDAVDTSTNNFKIESYHCMNPRKLPITRMDPSCTVGFYIRDAKEFQKFIQEIREYVFPVKQHGAYPLFIFAEGNHQDADCGFYTGADKGRVKVTHYHLDKNGQKHRTFSRDSEEFIVL